jgi:hypothetical protein
MNFKIWLTESAVNQTVYHGTDKKFKKFSLKRSTMGIIWFTSDKSKVVNKQVGASGHGYILSLKVNIKNPAGWDEYDKYLLMQLKQMGYDGAILPDEDGHFDGFVFDPNQIEIINYEKN